MTKPREYTSDECREMFLDQIRAYVHYWATTELHPASEAENRSEIHRRLDGLAFSILNILDGTSAGLPSFVVAPSPHPDDKEFHKNEGENWWPRNHKVEDKLRGALHISEKGYVQLHDEYYRPERERRERPRAEKDQNNNG